MPAALQSVDDAHREVEFLLKAMLTKESPGFSKLSMSPDSTRLTHCQRDERGRSKLIFEMQVSEPLTNQHGNMHGGATASILDILTTLNFYLHTSGKHGDPWSLLGVSSGLQVDYFAPMPLGTYVDIECNSLAVGKRLGVVQCDFWIKDGKDGKRLKLAASGKHNKCDLSGRARL